MAGPGEHWACSASDSAGRVTGAEVVMRIGPCLLISVSFASSSGTVPERVTSSPPAIDKQSLSICSPGARKIRRVASSGSPCFELTEALPNSRPEEGRASRTSNAPATVSHARPRKVDKRIRIPDIVVSRRKVTINCGRSLAPVLYVRNQRAPDCCSSGTHCHNTWPA